MKQNIDGLRRLYSQQMEGLAQPLPQGTLNSLPVWVKSAVRISVLGRMGEPKEPFLYLVQPEPEVLFEHLMRIYRHLVERLNAPVLIVADHLLPKYRPLLVKFNIAFIYKNESIYAPELGLKFNRLKRFQEDRTIRAENKKKALTPFALKLIAGVLTNQISPEFTLKGLHETIQREGVEVSSSKLSLGLKELVAYGLLLSEGGGPTRRFAKADAKKTWEKILMLQLASFFREVEINFVPTNGKVLCLAGETALAQYSNLAEDGVKTIAMSVKEFRKNYEGKKSQIPIDKGYASSIIQIWKEPPHLFAFNNTINPIELFFSLKNHPDERVKMALDEMLIPYGLVKKEI